ncbi:MULTISPECIES: hypothetical protein [unclassified Shinella]|jgi:hypothetical protein|uniref:hypothetical protein n=1 Tax=unclassified Shinella TaxID=2643062 RepID=UPI0003C56CEB|nr:MULTISPECIES: hypothetical protein [unclassified Shinella]MCA0342254.1 hypothetical protein [Pseudomonadota bacterium]EYR81704.1 hypothetical protein SHLA_27c000920 [Shinella sp. DD12]MCO5154109.1 hypothetical protein [Shinella sp.]MDC7260911.1 hypothetical protein [Shinella sp. HY16]MDC7267806.1 hypothetical protein [Shinella sp. YZ44]
MSGAASETRRPGRITGRLAAFIVVAAGLAVFAGANAHLVYVALTSQPDCVQHLKTEGRDGAYRAARPSC